MDEQPTILQQPIQPNKLQIIQQQPQSTTIVTNTPPNVTVQATAPTVTTPITTTHNVVTIPIHSNEEIYTYVAVKGSLHDTNASVFGLNREEIIALSKRFNNALTEILNGYMIKAHPIEVVNSLSKLGYKVVGVTGEAEIVWTLQREI